MEPGDLVFIRNYAVDGQKRQKLEAKWLKLQILVLYLASKLTRYICKVYSNSKAKMYHLNNILLYQKKSSLFVNKVSLFIKPEKTILTVIERKKIGELGK